MSQKKPIAVVGMAGLFPGARNIEIFWQNILNGVDACGEVHPGRWRVAPDSMYQPEPQPDKAYSKRCGLITDFKFDPAGMDVDPNLLTALDPLYHIVLQVGKERSIRYWVLGIGDWGLVPIYSNLIMFAKDFSNKIFSPPRHQDTKFN